MAPPSADFIVQNETTHHLKNGNSVNDLIRTPLKYSGTLDQYQSFDVTSVIGREFPTAQLSEILKDDAKVRDLAITVSKRGVVFFRNQDLDVEAQKALGQRLGELTGKPDSSKLHKHALLNSKRGIAVDENGSLTMRSRLNLLSISFEHIPSDYAILKIVEPPNDAGGDTLWASGYEAYDRLSSALQKLAEGLTATHYQPAFKDVAKQYGLELIEEDRGAPENTGVDFKAVHPVVRTNPVTGWKSLFGAGHQAHAGWINDVTERESEIIEAYFLQLIAENHDLQVRFRWTKNDVAIWDNRSVFHTATNDYEVKRHGNCVDSLGGKPYFDPHSVSRREALAAV